MNYNQGHRKWYEWVKLQEYHHHAQAYIYHSYSVQKNHSVQVSATNRHGLAGLTLTVTETRLFNPVKEPHKCERDPDPNPLTLMDDQLLQLAFGGGTLYDALVDGVGSDQAVHHHRSSLTNAVTSVLSLQVALGVLEKTREKEPAATLMYQRERTDP